MRVRMGMHSPACPRLPLPAPACPCLPLTALALPCPGRGMRVRMGMHCGLLEVADVFPNPTSGTTLTLTQPHVRYDPN